MLVTELVVVVEDVKREAFEFEVGRLVFVVEVDRIDEDVTVRGGAFCGGVARPITGGETGVDLVEEVTGLSQEEKKSSSSLAVATLLSADDVISGMPST